MERTPPARARWWRHRWPEIGAALIGLGWFLAIGGWRAIPVTSLDWLRGDPWQHVMGWLFFRRSGWSIPIGRVEGFPWPLGTTLGFTDANPLVALPLRLVARWLPLDFQYVGAWLAACFALQGWFGARLAALGSDRPWWRLLGGAFFAVSPVLLARIGHDTLSAHWAVLALLLLYLEPHRSLDAERRAVRAAIGVALLVALVHPYLAFMVLALALALLVRTGVDGVLPWRGVAWRAVALVFGQAALFAVQGYFTTARAHGDGYGLFATDLLALVNPGGASWLLPDVPTRPEQAEGYAYLGVGGIALVAFVAVRGLFRRGAGTAADDALGAAVAARLDDPGRGSSPRLPGSAPEDRSRPVTLAPLIVAVLLMAAHAVTPVVHLAGEVLLDARATFRPLTWLTGPLRSSGRFIWPAWYLLVVGALVVLARRTGPRRGLATALLGLALVLQLADLAPRAIGSRFRAAPWRLRAPTWALARGEYDLLALVPPQIFVEDSQSCRGRIWGDDDHWAPFAWVAYAQGMAVNSAQLARGAVRLLDRACEAFEREVEAGILRPRTVYVVHPSWLPVLERAGAACGRIEGYPVCVSPAQHDAFRAALAPR